MTLGVEHCVYGQVVLVLVTARQRPVFAADQGEGEPRPLSDQLVVPLELPEAVAVLAAGRCGERLRAGPRCMSTFAPIQRMVEGVIMYPDRHLAEEIALAVCDDLIEHDAEEFDVPVVAAGRQWGQDGDDAIDGVHGFQAGQQIVDEPLGKVSRVPMLPFPLQVGLVVDVDVVRAPPGVSLAELAQGRLVEQPDNGRVDSDHGFDAVFDQPSDEKFRDGFVWFR